MAYCDLVSVGFIRIFTIINVVTETQHAEQLETKPGVFYNLTDPFQGSVALQVLNRYF